MAKTPARITDVLITIKADLIAPTAPTLGTPTVVSTSVLSVPLTAASTDVGGLKEYVLERAPAATGPFTEIGRSLSLFPFASSGLTAATTYYYRAKAVDNSLNDGNYSGVVSATTQAVVSTFFPLSVSSNGRYLQRPNGTPFLVVGRASWSLARLTLAQVRAYMDDCVARGINTIIVEHIEHSRPDNASPTQVLGQNPFNTPEDIRTPNDAYFIGFNTLIMDEALSRDLLVLLSPMYVGIGGGAEGWWNSAFSPRTTGEIQTYATYAGGKVAPYPNVIIAGGGDASGSTYNPKSATFIAAFRAAGNPAWLAGWHAERNVSSSDTGVAEGQSWYTPPLGVNFCYTSDANIVSRLHTDYSRATTRPIIYFEGYYKGLTNEVGAAVTDQTLRAQRYHSINHGNGGVTGWDPQWYFGSGYTSQLGDSAAQDLTRAATFASSIPWHTIVPDLTASVLTAGIGTNENTASCGRVADGSMIIAYTPTQKALTFDMTKITGVSANVRWFNPTTGVYGSTTNVANSGSQAFTPPSAGDWILRIDAVQGSTFAHGDSVTITGSGFGATMPTFWFAGGATGPLETTAVGATPGNNGNGIGVPMSQPGTFSWSRFAGDNHNGTTSHYVRVGTDSTRGKCIVTDDLNSDTNYESSVGFKLNSSMQPGDRIYMAYWHKATLTGTDGQHKLFRFCSDNISDNFPQFIQHVLSGSHNSPLMKPGNGSELYYGGSSNGYFQPNGTWMFVELFVQVNTQGVADGQARTRVFRAGSVPSFVDFAGNDPAPSGPVMHMNTQMLLYSTAARGDSIIWQGWVGNGYTGGSVHDDDHYVSRGFKRVQLWNSLTPSAATLRENQQATAWADGSITVRLNKGGLTAGTYFLVVLADSFTDTVLASRSITVT